MRFLDVMTNSYVISINIFDFHIDMFFPLGRAVGALSDSKGFVEDLLKGKTVDLSFQGIDHFRNEVGFVKLAKNDHTAILTEIAGTTCQSSLSGFKTFEYLDENGTQT